MRSLMESQQQFRHVDLSLVAHVVAGVGFPRHLQGRKKGSYPFFKVGDISRAWQAGKAFLHRADHYLDTKELDQIRAKPIPAGATVLAKIGAAVALNRRAILSQPSLVDNNCFAVVPREDTVSIKFMFFFLCTVDLGKRTRATTVPSLRKGDVETLQLPAWNLTYQELVVAEIEKHFTRLDAAVAALERVQANLKRARASVLQAAVEGRLVPTEAELARREGRDYEPASVLLERILEERRRRWEEGEVGGKRRRKYKEPVGPHVEAILPAPEGWTYATAGQLLENHDSARIPVKRADRAARQGPYPYYGASGIIDSIDGFTHDGSFLLVGEDGANLLARSKPIAFQAHGPFWVNNHAHVLLPFCQMPLGYFEVSFNQSDLSPFVTGSAQPKLPQRALTKIPIALPPINEQRRIVTEVERRFSVLDALERTVMQNITRCARLRQSILKRAFEGTLVPQDPSDEPASELLARIRAQAPQPKRKRARR